MKASVRPAQAVGILVAAAGFIVGIVLLFWLFLLAPLIAFLGLLVYAAHPAFMKSWGRRADRNVAALDPKERELMNRRVGT
ncbi:MAG: hypothetical protein M0031_12665 [Thermaerobacter sp.]|jgi:type IV secretory pathway VirB3-like protein|nr:hypothetical protein [Thermaerobacter sp.]